MAFALSRQDGFHDADEDVIQILPYHPFGIISQKNRRRVPSYTATIPKLTKNVLRAFPSPEHSIIQCLPQKAIISTASSVVRLGHWQVRWQSL
jgi:hypothetical protein